MQTPETIPLLTPEQDKQVIALMDKMLAVVEEARESALLGAFASALLLAGFAETVRLSPLATVGLLLEALGGLQRKETETGR